MTLYTERLPVEGPGLSNFSFPGDHALIVVGDSHGQSEALHGLLAFFGRTPTPGKKRTLVFLGDFIDRGPDSLGCLRTALNDGADLAAADEVQFLPGNHELLLADTLEDAADEETFQGGIYSRKTWLNNGGMAFLAEAFSGAGAEVPKGEREALLRFGELLPHPGHDSFADMVRSWPSHFSLGDVLCVHAGISPKAPHAHTLDLAQRDHMGASFMDNVGDRHWAWIRDEFLSWQGGWAPDGAPHEDGCLVIHGHTVPNTCRSGMQHGDRIRKAFCRMPTNARICVDGGSAYGIGVAGAMVSADGVRIAFEPT